MIIEGKVVKGKQLGRTIGFPTANIEVVYQQGSGPDGVYAAFIEIDGQRRFSMVNIGNHPTLPGGGKTVEAHILGFSGDIYGRSVALETVEYLRPEKKFGSVEELKQQLRRDEKTCEAILYRQISTPPGIE